MYVHEPVLAQGVYIKEKILLGYLYYCVTVYSHALSSSPSSIVPGSI